MSITLSWKQQPRQTLDSIEIYRFADPRATPNPLALGTPLAVLPGDATSYVDNTVANYATYQYRIVSVKGGDKSMGAPIVQGYFPQTGPGPQELLRGDWYCGYFGTLTNSEFFLNAGEFNGLFGSQLWGYSPVLFHKFVFRGKILFFPDTLTAQNTPWRTYAAGVMYGVDNNGPLVPSGYSGVNQKRTVVKNGYEYIVRLPTLVDGVYSSSWNNQTYYNQGEWHNTMGRLYRTGLSLPRFNDLPLQSGASPTALGCALMASAVDVGRTYWYWNPAAPTSPATIDVDSNCSIFHVLELVLS